MKLKQNHEGLYKITFIMIDRNVTDGGNINYRILWKRHLWAVEVNRVNVTSRRVKKIK